MGRRTVTAAELAEVIRRHGLWLADAKEGERADLRSAYLSGADLRGAYLRSAYLSGADLRGAALNWKSHDTISSILRREAGGDVARRALAGMILVSRDWCWSTWLRPGALGPLEDQREWALGVLRGYVREGDGAPEALRDGAGGA